MHTRLALLAFLALAACQPSPAPVAHSAAPVTSGQALAESFDCLRVAGLGLVSAHRGQADPTRAENALSSFRETVALGPILLEVDVGRTADGVLVLLHDDTLDRTTTGTGPLAARRHAELADVRLKTPAGEVLAEGIPTLTQVLAWGRSAGARFQIDLKPGVRAGDVWAEVTRAGMAGSVILISYDAPATAAALSAAPGALVSGSARTPAEADALVAIGGNQSAQRLLGFTGTRLPDPAVIARLHARDVEVISGTLGRAGERLDDRFMADGDGSEYAALVGSGVQLIASDRPRDAWAALVAAGKGGTTCLR